MLWQPEKDIIFEYGTYINSRKEFFIKFPLCILSLMSDTCTKFQRKPTGSVTSRGDPGDLAYPPAELYWLPGDFRRLL